MVFALPYLKDLPYPNDSFIIRAITIFLATLGNGTVIMIIIFCLIWQKQMIGIGDQLHEFDGRFGAKLLGGSTSSFHPLRTFVTIAVMIAIWTAVVIMELRYKNGIIYLITSGLSQIFISWLLLQYSLMINALQYRFQKLNDTLLDATKTPIINENSHQERNPSVDRLIGEHLILVKQARTRMFNVFKDISRHYSFPVLVSIFHCCCCIVYDSYFYIVTAIKPATGSEIVEVFIESLFWILMVSYPIVVLSASVTTFQVEAYRTADVLYDIKEAFPSNKVIKSQVTNFAVELLHRKVDISPYGLFSLDCTLLRTISGTMVTYLLFLVQFKASESDL
ncbi:putative gustatory receptor 2a [Fopius arisanus]|uniref:Gustatory receptor n=1 Tax=Fopius arisanus TaxID=64838 RepID=A0A9R1TGN4_9HYME|nr:PREDICTED: putative gustatory receptor 2a [Fopius arisanus]